MSIKRLFIEIEEKAKQGLLGRGGGGHFPHSFPRDHFMSPLQRETKRKMETDQSLESRSPISQRLRDLREKATKGHRG